MSIWRRAQADLPAGAYDEVVSAALGDKLARLAETHSIDFIEVGRDTEVDEQLIYLIRDATSLALLAKRDAGEKIALARRLLQQLEAENCFRPGETDLRPQLLKGIAPLIAGHPRATTTPPRGSLLSSGLITNAHGESVLEHLSSEFATADRIWLLCSFIKLSGLDKFRGLIERHRALGRPLRVLTTTYMRATEAKAIDLLQRLGAEVRISYDESSTRLHAKAWIFHRDSEYSTAYVGSSNLSHSAQTQGLEWNLRIAQADQPDLVEEMTSVFERYWNDADRFEPFDGSELARQRLARALTERERAGDFAAFDLEPRDWQKPILRELDEARALGRHRNLIVAATGTGKTLIAAFDYDRLQRAGRVESLLFVAHRREILDQARRVFRHVLKRPDFGEFWGDGHTPATFRHVFAMIQTIAQAKLAPDEFDHVIVDEVHHAAARSYNDFLDAVHPAQLVGLTATPERADGRVYEHHFPRPYVGNLRLWDAIEQQILVPFRYFVLDADGLDLTQARWEGGYVDSDLSHRLITSAEIWVRAVVRALADYIARPTEVRALAFCVDKAHARVVAERLTHDAHLASRALTDETPREERDRAKGDLTSGRVQVLCVVDLFNEGVDIPDVNTLLLFRPTESPTVFLQQLGRGLRRSREKDILTIFDITGRQHPRFRVDRNLRVLLGHTPRELREFVKDGFGRLPSGCTFRFEEHAQGHILEQIRRAIPADIRGIRELLREHGSRNTSLAEFLAESEIDLLDLYRDRRSWTSLRAGLGFSPQPDQTEGDSLSRLQNLLHVSDPLRLGVWKRLIDLQQPTSILDRRITGMLFAILYGRTATQFEITFARWAREDLVREELRQLIPILEARADSLPRADILAPDVPLVIHARYLDLELSAAFHAITKTDGLYRHFYTGVEPVADGALDLLLVTLEKGNTHEHLKYQDFPLSETRFQWQSQSSTRQDDPNGRRHLGAAPVTSLLFVRETKKDARGITCAFRYLGPVQPASHRGERPITIAWALATPLLPEWVRKWSNVS